MGYEPSNNAAEAERLRQPMTSEDDLWYYFKSSFKDPEDVAIGMEVEKHGIRKSDYTPITYAGPSGLRKIQEKMIEELDWRIEREEGKYITSMSRGGSKLSLEVSEAMSELAGRTHPSIHDLVRELRIHQHELSEISRVFDTVWLGIGYQPFAALDELRTVKIQRYEVAAGSVSRRLRTVEDQFLYGASVQANIDYTSEEDAQTKFHILLQLAPFLSAMYANSPLKQGKNTGYVSYRTHLLRQLDRRRYGLRKMFYQRGFDFKDWVEFCLHVPMVTIIRDGNWIPVKNCTFQKFLKSGYREYSPILEDWIMHLSFIYTDVRIKRYLELRICDALPPALIPSMQAIVKSFVYHKDGADVLKKITKGWQFTDFATVYGNIAKKGVQTEVREKKLLDYCKEILDFSTASLRSFKILNENGEDESVYLEPIKEYIFVKEKSPGQFVMENWDGDWKKNPERLIEWCSFEQIPPPKT